MKNMCTVPSEALGMLLFRRVSILLAMVVEFVFGGFGLKWSAPDDAYIEVEGIVPTPRGVDVNGDGVPDILAFRNWDYGSDTIDIYSGVSYQLLWRLDLTPWWCRHASGWVGIGTANIDPDPSQELVVCCSRVMGDSTVGVVRVYDCISHSLEYEAPAWYHAGITGLIDVDGDSLADICLTGSVGLGGIYGWTRPGVNEYKPTEFRRDRIWAAPVPSKNRVRIVIPVDAAKNTGVVTVVDTGGRVIRKLELLDGLKGSSETEIWWDCLDDQSRPVPAGHYFYRCGQYSRKIEVVR